jgi:glycosyltransferase involved in cell wall biosynthesis
VPARIAVIVPCFNDADLVRQAVGSVEESEPVEIVVVDDHSTDEATLAVLAELERDGVRVLRRDHNAGVAAARQAGLGATGGEFVFPLDADDLAVPGALAAMAAALESAPDAAVCFADYAEFGDAELVRAVPERLDPYRLAYTNEYPISSLFRRGALEAVGGFTPNGYGGRSYEDWNLWMTLAESGARGVHLGPGRIGYRRRLHGERKLHTGKRRHRELYRELRAEHPRLFRELPEHRRRSDLSGLRKRLYPVVYGGRRRLGFESRVKAALDRLRIWTLRR